MAYMSQEGYDKLVAQLKEMETIERPAASAAIAEARDKGDPVSYTHLDVYKRQISIRPTKLPPNGSTLLISRFPRLLSAYTPTATARPEHRSTKE